MNLLVGDVQGCDEALGRLLAACGFSPSRDHLVLLGDLVNRGPQSLAVLQRLRGLGNAATCLLGNHDLHLLAIAHGVRRAHKTDTVAAILTAPDSAAWVDWLRHRPLAHLQDGWLCVHAGVLPAWTTAQTLALATEVETLLQGPDLQGVLQQMYGNEPRHWSPDLPGPERTRLVINALTRLRYCTADGGMDFQAKEGADQAPPGLYPWFDMPGRQTQGQPIAFGHWSTLGLINTPELLSLDTGCVWGGALSTMRVDGGRRELFQVPCSQAQSPTPGGA
jgi:bis(5'-nucleosyl)-tetraphosphatase (symmetrical)